MGCRNRQKRTAYAASILQLDGTDKLVWPLINAKSLKLRIDGKVNNETPWAAHRALTVGEEKDIVEAVKLLNLHGQGVDREQLTRLVMESLEMRPVLNRGRNCWAREGRARARGSCPGVRGDLRACAVYGGGLDWGGAAHRWPENVSALWLRVLGGRC